MKQVEPSIVGNLPKWLDYEIEHRPQLAPGELTADHVGNRRRSLLARHLALASKQTGGQLSENSG